MKTKLNTRLLISVAAAALFVAVVCWFLVAVSRTEAAASAQRLETLKQSVENSITLCYSIEGVYPESLDYLKENYAVRYDDSEYIVHYDCFAANIRPTVTVIERLQ